MNGGPAGDLFVRIHVASHPVFGRSGKRDLTLTVPITFPEAALGAVVQVPTLDGTTKIRIPPGTQSGTTMRVTGKGVATSSGTGGLLVTIEVAVPTDLSDTQRDMLETFKNDRSTDNPREYLGV